MTSSMPSSGTNRYSCVITTVDPNAKTVTGEPAPLVAGVIKSGKAIQISLYDIDTAFRWPIVGETWMVIQYNNSWYLEGLFPFQTQAANNITNYNQGDLVLNSGTGKLAVVGTTADSAGTNKDFQLYVNNGSLNYESNNVATPLMPQTTYTSGYATVASSTSVLSPQGTSTIVYLDSGIEAANGLSVSNNAVVVPPGIYFVMASVNVDPNRSSNGYGGVGFFAPQVWINNNQPPGSYPGGTQLGAVMGTISSASVGMFASNSGGIYVATEQTTLSLAAYWNESGTGPTAYCDGRIGVFQIGSTPS